MRVQEQPTPRRIVHEREQPPQRPALPFARRFPIGAEPLPDGGAHFRVWAPKAKAVKVELCPDTHFEAGSIQAVELKTEEHGYFSGYARQAATGMCYRLRLGEGAFPDPASRFQPEGPHGPSQIVDPARFRWTDADWTGVPRKGQVIYEMHIGTFTREGTWQAAQAQLAELKRLGITLLEVMPVAEFPGRFGWGYDGVGLFAPTRLYGQPDDFRAFVDAAHRIGLGVILDVVYNHLGPDGNYLKQFSEDYFSARHQCEWGEAINFDGEGSGPVREFFVTNAAYWIAEFHVDGLRLDATQQIFDDSPSHILGVISRKVHEAAPGRAVYLVGENECQHSRLARPLEENGYGLDALWNDDFHHAARVALTGRSEAYYSDYRGTPQEFISALKYGFLYQGQWFAWQKKHRGMPSRGLAPEQFVCFLQNHDQVANSLRGQRLGALTSPGRLRALTALFLLGPNTPMLFQGQEFGASTPFCYFADHHPELAQLVAQGRGDFLRQFESVACPECAPYVADAAAEATFLRSKLDLSEREKHREIYRLHGELLKLRREDGVFSNPRPGGVDGAVLGPHAFVIRFFGSKQEDRLLLINLGVNLRFHPLAEPLLAPTENSNWKLMWSSEDPRYGGCGTPVVEKEGVWRVPGHSALVLGA